MVRGPLDVDAMNAASAALLGLNDFAAFCRRRRGRDDGAHPARLRAGRGPAALLVATVVADAFCHSMVRALVGAVLEVGPRPAAGRLAGAAAGGRGPRPGGPRRAGARPVPGGGHLPARRPTGRRGSARPGPAADMMPDAGRGRRWTTIEVSTDLLLASVEALREDQVREPSPAAGVDPRAPADPPGPRGRVAGPAAGVGPHRRRAAAVRQRRGPGRRDRGRRPPLGRRAGRRHPGHRGAVRRPVRALPDAGLGGRGAARTGEPAPPAG